VFADPSRACGLKNTKNHTPKNFCDKTRIKMSKEGIICSKKLSDAAKYLTEN
jgi:hypothetical protein